LEIRRALIKELSSGVLQNKADTLGEMKRCYDELLSSASDKYGDPISVVDKIELCRCCFGETSISRDFREILLGSDEKCALDAVGKIAYVKNNYADSAYLMFTKTVSSPSAYYCPSIGAVCEEVYSGSCEYCILPIETDTDCKLMTFYSSIDKYELKIHSVCTVYYSDGQRFTKFALLKKSVAGSGIFSASEAYLSKRTLEVKISQTSTADTPLCNILKAADACSLKLQRIDSLPLSYNKELLGYYAVFSMNRADFKTFLIYLALEYTQSYVVGIYSSVN
jgi:prephenate dehydratase